MNRTSAPGHAVDIRRREGWDPNPKSSHEENTSIRTPGCSYFGFASWSFEESCNGSWGQGDGRWGDVSGMYTGSGERGSILGGIVGIDSQCSCFCSLCDVSSYVSHGRFLALASVISQEYHEAIGHPSYLSAYLHHLFVLHGMAKLYDVSQNQRVSLYLVQPTSHACRKPMAADRITITPIQCSTDKSMPLDYGGFTWRLNPISTQPR